MHPHTSITNGAPSVIVRMPPTPMPDTDGVHTRLRFIADRQCEESTILTGYQSSFVHRFFMLSATPLGSILSEQVSSIDFVRNII